MVVHNIFNHEFSFEINVTFVIRKRKKNDVKKNIQQFNKDEREREQEKN